MTKKLTIFGLTTRRSTARLPGVFATLAIACAILFSSAQLVRSQTAVSPIPLPSPFTPIVDNAHVLDADTVKNLGAIYLNLKNRADVEFAVVTVDTTGDRDIFDYSLAVYRGWGIGSKTNDGFLLLVAIKDHKYFTQVGNHLEGDLNDGLVGQIQRERLVPEFKKGNYSKGIYDTVQAYVATLAEKRGFSIEGIDQRYAYRGTQTQPGQSVDSSPGGLPSGCCQIIFILVIVIVLLAIIKRGGGGKGGCLNAFLLGSLLNSGGRGSWGGSSSGWGGGGFGGGSWGGGGGGFGGGFGGGSAGGGGAGGSW
ncbi:MAG TPA: TPM domain-containing protein [Pyrinomonadaceae bacterium]|nr:TPM domain-containing protein [Pyrinomonadaceae bacterium]